MSAQSDPQQPTTPDMSGIDPSATFSPMMIAALNAREQYMSWRRVGFTARQSFALLRDMFRDYRMIHAGLDDDGDDE